LAWVAAGRVGRKRASNQVELPALRRNFIRGSFNSRLSSRAHLKPSQMNPAAANERERPHCDEYPEKYSL
jgi:hypothetical protein